MSVLIFSFYTLVDLFYGIFTLYYLLKKIMTFTYGHFLCGIIMKDVIQLQDD